MLRKVELETPTWFQHPARHDRPVPLYWWTGADIQRERVSWHLDQLADKGVGGVIIGYSHTADGSADHGSPAPFTDHWWSLLRWLADECEDRGMTAGIQDYNLVAQSLRRSGARTPGASGTLVEQHMRVTGPTRCHLNATPAGPVIAALAIPTSPTGDADIDHAVDVRASVAHGSLTWDAPRGHWLISVVSLAPAKVHGVPTTFDPLHPHAASSYIDDYLEPFSRELGERLGRSLTTFFQDELDFGMSMPMWSPAVAAGFAKLQPTAIDAVLPALWHDVGSATAAIRLRYHEVVVSLLEGHFFRPVWDWHERHGTRTAMDQLSRGDLRAGHAHYADYMRTMRWFHAPGNDDPDLRAPRQVAAFKISSSIAHLYGRAQVWNEAFHSSGWGVTPEDLVRGANVGFAAGATHTSLHAIYYTTEGGWWEWAPPDFHFRQPWWQHSTALWDYLARMAALLSRGRHVCDIAVLDPTDDLAVSGGATVSPETLSAILDLAPRRGIDVDVLNSESLLRAETTGGVLAVAGEEYRLLVLPRVRYLPEPVARALAAFVEGGGIVVCFGDLPEAILSCGPKLFSPLEQLLPGTWVIVPAEAGTPGLIDVLKNLPNPDFTADVEDVMHNHRHFDGSEVYLVVNNAEVERAMSVSCVPVVD